MAGASTGPTAVPPFDVSASLLLDERPRRTDLSRAGASIREDNHVGDDVSIGANAAGNPARVIKQVAGLTCPPGWFERPYTWPRYEPPGSGEKGNPAALSSPFALPRTGAFSAEVSGARAATQYADTALMAARLRLAAISAGDPTLNLLVHHALGHYCRHRRLGAEALVMRRRANAIDHCASCAILQP
jgi:hypothetical protein